MSYNNKNNKNNKNNNNTNKGNNIIVKPTEERYLADKISVLYDLFDQRDSLMKVYNRSVVIKTEDILGLKDLIYDKLSNYSLPESRNNNVVTVDVGLSGGKNLHFGVWKEFEQYKWNEIEYIKHINILFKCYIDLPNQEIPQRYTLSVKLTSNISPNELLNLIFTGKIEDVDDFEINAANIVARVDFVNQTLGDELINIVDKWVKGLDYRNMKQNNFVLVLRKYRKWVAYFINYVPVCMICLVGILYIDKLYKFLIGQNDNLIYFKFSAIIIILFFLVYIIFGHLARSVFSKLEEYKTPFVFDITKGDRANMENIIHENTKNGRSTIFNIVINIIINIVCGILVTKYLS